MKRKKVFNLKFFNKNNSKILTAKECFGLYGGEKIRWIRTRTGFQDSGNGQNADIDYEAR